MITHPLKLYTLTELKTSATVNDLFDALEIMDVFDDREKIADEKAKLESNKTRG